MRSSWLTSSAFILIILFSTACSGQMARLDKPHHTEDGFINPQEKKQHSFWDLVKWRWDRLFKDIPGPGDYDFPVVKVDKEFINRNRMVNSATWIGHATLLVQISGINILTDPQFSQRASPLQWIGPQRVVPPAVELSDLPVIDYVIISHDHYDSLDEDSVTELFEREKGEQTTFIVPLGLKAWFADLGITRVKELDWWEAFSENGLTFTALPSQHWSKRSMFSRNTTLWAAWAVKSSSFNFYFCGDSGYYAPMFKEIGDKMGPFDLAAIPVGAYEPRWFMKDKHVNPEEAVQVHLDIRSRKSIGIHWGTFILTDEPLGEPPLKLAEAKNTYSIIKDAFILLKHGETIRFDK